MTQEIRDDLCIKKMGIGKVIIYREGHLKKDIRGYREYNIKYFGLEPYVRYRGNEYRVMMGMERLVPSDRRIKN